MVDGIVLLDLPNELAWSIYMNTTDYEHVEDYNSDIMMRYAKLFPGTAMTRVILSFFRWIKSEHDEKRDEAVLDTLEDEEEMGDIIAVSYSIDICNILRFNPPGIANKTSTLCLGAPTGCGNLPSA